jgi:hypothetical protein
MPRGYKKGQSQLKVEICTGVYEERTWAREAKEYALLEAVAGNGWWKKA